mgnify:CR=1 FL=1
MEYLLVVVVAALAGYLAYRVSLSLGRKLARDEVLQMPPPAERTTTGAAGPAEDLRAPHPSPEPPGEAPPEPRSHRWRTRGGGRDPASDGFAYGVAPLPPLRIPARTRLLGILGLVALIVLAAALIAVALYQAGHLVRLRFESYLG